MGTNYYTKINECEHCNRYNEIHLGKSSAGWQFSFQYNGGRFYKNVKEMKEWLKDKKIEDEYGSTITHKDFWEMVKDKQIHSNRNHADTFSVNNHEMLIDGYSFTDCEFC